MMKTRLVIISALLLGAVACKDNNKTNYEENKQMEEIGEEKVEAMEKAREWKENGSEVKDSVLNDSIPEVEIDSNLTNH